MGVNVPQFNRCCFCIPLREGLLALGYINLVYHGLLFFLAAAVAFFVAMVMVSYAGEFPPLEVTLLLPLVTVSEVTFYVFVLLATHMRDARLLRATVILGTALLIFTVPYSVCLIYRLAREKVKVYDFYDDASKNRFINGMYITALLLDPIILGYTLLLVWSFNLQMRRKVDEKYNDLETNREQGTENEQCLPTKE